MDLQCFLFFKVIENGGRGGRIATNHQLIVLRFVVVVWIGLKGFSLKGICNWFIGGAFHSY